ncbi:bifunctional phage-like tail fiber protein/heme utilization protein [Acinetobacter baumannii]|nr:bifunctional phage-like tail fiber protein/heme utilization protein [Acinetobacter baumannii]
MALDPNINRIKHLRSSTAGAVPAASLLDEGEIAVNLVDRTIFSKNGANVVELGFGKGGTVTGPISVTGGNAVTAAQFNGALNGNAATASRLLTGRKINNVVFDGTRDITIEDSTKLYKENVLTTSGDSRIIRDVATIRAAGTANGALIIHLPKAVRNASTMMKIIIQGFDYSSGLSSQGPWSVNLTGYNYTGPTWHSYQAVSTGSKAPFEHVRYGQAADHNVIILGGTSGDASIPTSSWTYYNISIEKIYLTANNTTLYSNPADPIYLTIEDSLTPYSVQVTLPLEGVNLAESLRTKRTFTFTGDATGSLAFDGTANVSTALTINSATTGQAGLVKLNNTLTSTSVTEALTAAQGKALQDTKVNRSGDTISGRLVVTQGITTPSISNDVTVPISFLGPSVNNSNAGGIRVRNLEVNNQYGVATRAFGIFSKDGLVAGDTTAYASLAAIGTGNNIPFKVNDTNVGTSYGFVPFIGGNVQSSSGYRTVTSIGVYRPGPNWADSGMYIATGSSDGASTEAFLFKLGRTISSTTGPVYLEGIADYSRNVDASAGMLASDDTSGWRKLGRATLGQSGRTMSLKLIGGTGFNAYNPQQAGTTIITLKSGNSNPATITMTVNIEQKNNLLSNGGWLPNAGPSACFVKVGTSDDYDIYVHTSGYLYASMVVTTGYQTSWQQDFQSAASGAKPTGAVDAYVYNTLDSLDPEVFGAITFKNSVATPAKNTEYTKLSMIPPTHTGGTWLHRLNDTDSIAEYIIKYGPTPVLRMDSSGVVYTSTLRNSGATHLGNQTELGTIGTASQVYIDFHSGASNIDYDARIMSSGGTTAIGNGALSYIAASHAFNGRVDGGLISASTGLGISNSSNTVLAGLSLYAGAQSGKPTYGITFAGTGNAGTGKHGDIDNATWAVYLTCATTGAEKRGWIFQRSDNNTNVASISTAGVLSTNGSIQTLNDNTMINVGNNSDLALVKKVSNSGFIGVGSTAGFAVKRSNATSVDPSNTFTDLFTVRANGDLDITGNSVYIGNGINQNTYETIQFGNYTKATGGGGFSVIHMPPVGSPDGRVLQLANYTEAGVVASALYVSSSGTYQTVGTTTLKLATIADNVASATKLQTPRTIGGVAFDGTSNINLPGVNIQGNQNTTGNAASATRLQTARTFQITGGITTNAVSFDGQQNVTLTASNVDGSKVTGKVPAAAQADNATNAVLSQRTTSVDVNGQLGVRLAAMWSGTVYHNHSKSARYYSPTQIQIELGETAVVTDRINNMKVGNQLHVVFAGSTGWSNGMVTGTIDRLTTNVTSGSIDAIVSIPHSISPGNATSCRILAVTYSSIGCSFIGSVSSYAKASISTGDWSWLLQTSSNVVNPFISTASSGDIVDRNASLFPLGFIKDGNPTAMAATMLSSNICNFVVGDNNNDSPSHSGFVSVQIWDRA